MSQPKHIAFLAPNLNGGGLERVVVNLLKGMVKHNLKLDLVLTSATGPLLKDVPSEVRIIDLKTPLGLRLKSATQVISPLVNYLRQEKPDVVFSNLLTYNLVAVVAVALARVPTYLVLIEHLSLQETKNRRRGFQFWLLPLLMRYLYPRADAVLAVSKRLARELEADLKMKSGTIKTIYNPVIDDNLLLKSQESIENPWFKDGEVPVVLGVGRLVDQKDFSTLIRAFAIVRKTRPARLVILGDGVEKKKLQSLISELGLEDDVALLGFVENPYAYMSKATVFALSSAWEGFGNVLVEAMAVGTPVVSTNCESGPEEILDNGKYGELVSVGDREAMAAAILRVLAGNVKSVDPAWLEQFTLENATLKYLEFLGFSESN